MTKVDTRTLPLETLNELRREAVRLRLASTKLAEITSRTGLSAPTIIAAHKAFLSGGWAALPVKPRGRITGSGRVLAAEEETEILRSLATTTPDQLGLPFKLWQIEAVQLLVQRRYGIRLAMRTTAHYLQRWGMTTLRPSKRIHDAGASRSRWAKGAYAEIQHRAKMENGEIHWVEETNTTTPQAGKAATPRINLIQSTTPRGKVRWLAYDGPLRAPVLIDFFDRLLADVDRKLFVVLDSMHWQRAAALSLWIDERPGKILRFFPPEESDQSGGKPGANATAKIGSQRLLPGHNRTDLTLSGQLKHLMADIHEQEIAYSGFDIQKRSANHMNLTHLQRLEAESIQIMREVVAEVENPVMLYSVGKDSAVMLHLAQKAFYPAVPPFPLLHVDTTWKFRDMYAMRDRMAKELGMDLLVYHNPEALEKGINPFDHGSQIHTDLWKTEGLKQALDKYAFDAAFGGARRDEEKSRAKERIFSFRSAQHRWDPKNQRPELWHIYNTRKQKGESIRVFPISNWTELDIWQYIHLENIPIVPLYFSALRPVVERDGTLIMVDDERMPLKEGEVPMMRKVRFRTLGCYPLTGAVESEATTLPEIIQEMLLTKTSERQGRVIDHDAAASMEKKKQEGYF